jgi:hypothetical protein
MIALRMVAALFLMILVFGRDVGKLFMISASVAEKNRLYRCLDRVLEHKRELFLWLRGKWADLFQAEFEVLLYDLTSTYFEGAMEENPKAKYGHSRDKRTDCLQVVIALVITTDGFPLAYEVMDGNTSDRTTLRDFLDRIEKTYGRAKRMWVMDRGVPTEQILQQMRDPGRQISYLVGTPRGKIRQYEKKWLDLPWLKVRDAVQVKLYQDGGELYVTVPDLHEIEIIKTWTAEIAESMLVGLSPESEEGEDEENHDQPEGGKAKRGKNPAVCEIGAGGGGAVGPSACADPDFLWRRREELRRGLPQSAGDFERRAARDV